MPKTVSPFNMDTNAVIIMFVTHIIPAILLIQQATWLALNVLRRYHRSALSNGREPFESQLWYPGPWTKCIPLDSAMRFVHFTYYGTTQFLVCYTTLIVPVPYPEDLQHGIVATAVVISAVFDMVTSLSNRQQSGPLPAGSDRVASFLSAVVMFQVFHAHEHGEIPLQTHLHSHLGLLAAVLVLSHLAEVLGRNNLWMALARPYALLLCGAWFWQISFILYVYPISWPRGWDGDPMTSFITSDFLLCAHLLMAFLLLLTMSVFVWRSEKINLKTDESDDRKGHYKVLLMAGAYDETRESHMALFNDA